MKKFLFSIILFASFFMVDHVFFQVISAHAANLAAFPGAVGFGSTTVGGRGGVVIEVTNLNNTGPGSFREACAASGPRIVVFRTGGTINASSIIKIQNPYITIAGQSAPGDGISLRGAGLTIMTHDVIVRGLRIRIGDAATGPTPSNRDGIQIENRYNPPYNILIDHCSVNWAVDESMTFWYAGLRDVTVSNTIIGEALYNSIHPDGPHAMGALCGNQGIENIAFIGNLFIHNNGRNPRLGSTSAAVINNVMYNIGNLMVDIFGSVEAQSISVAGNLFLKGVNTGSTSMPIRLRSDLKSGTKIYIADNDASDYTTGTYYVNQASFNPVVSVRQTWPAGFVAKPKEEVLEMVLNNVGASPMKRDPVDARLVADLRNRTGRRIDSQNDVGGWPNLAPGTPPADTDRDGMPDSWESDRGLNPNNSADGNGDRDGDGYTNVEEYLNGLFAFCEKITAGPANLRIVE